MITISEIRRLIELNVGDTERLRHIQESIEHSRPLYQSDIRYVTNLSLTYPEETTVGAPPAAEPAQSGPPQETEHVAGTNVGDAHVAGMFSHPYTTPSPTDMQEEPAAPQYRGAGAYKSEGVALCLSLTLGLVGFFGLGHRYVGAVWRGLGLLYLGWILTALNLLGPIPLAVSITLSKAGVASGSYWPPLLNILGYPQGAYTVSSMALIAVLPVAFLVTLVWQAHGAHNLCKKYNLHMEKNGSKMVSLTKRQKATFAALAATPLTASAILAAMLLGLPFF